MILEEETFKKFGYYPCDLKHHSGKPILAKCDNCGKIRKVQKRAYHILCHACALKELGKTYCGKKHHKWKGGLVQRSCLFCGKHFKAHPSAIKRGGGKFCSIECSHDITKSKIERKCPICGEYFFIWPSYMKRSNIHFCSQSCAGKANRKTKKIPTHHTKPELIFEEICKKNNLPFKYTGDSSFWIGKNPSINPDFIEANGKKIAVEIFGDYWHSPLLNRKLGEKSTLTYRKRALKKYGWELIVFWESDLKRKDAEQFVLSTLESFL